MRPQPAARPEDDAPHRFGVLARQLPFSAVFSALIVALVVAPGLDAVPVAVAVSIGLGFGATVLAAVVPWQLLPRWAEAVVPLVDMAAVTALLTLGTRASVLLVLPVLWLVRMGYAGVVVAIVAGIGASVGSDVVAAIGGAGRFVITPDNVARIIVVPAVIVAVAISLYLAERRSAARRDLLAGQSALVEELLAETSSERARLEGVLNTIDAGVAVLDAHGTVVVINRALREATAGVVDVGTPVTEIRNRLYVRDGVTLVSAEQLELVAQGDRLDRRVVWWERSPEERVAFRISSAPLRQRDGSAEGAVVALHDITDELTALAERDDFVSSVSHELRTPLTSITGYLDLALDAPDLPEDVRSLLEVVERNTGRLRILIDNLLTAARTGADPGSWEPVDLCEVVADVVESQTPRAMDRDMTLAVSTEGACMALGDVGRLTQVVDNIVSNAVKYSRLGGHAQIDVADVTGDAAHPEGQVRLTVTDDGPGIAAEDQAQLFTRFYRAPRVRSSPVQGTGLGLHITRQIVEALGGRITLRSAPGQGTSVEVLLPRAGKER